MLPFDSVSWCAAPYIDEAVLSFRRWCRTIPLRPALGPNVGESSGGSSWKAGEREAWLSVSLGELKERGVGRADLRKAGWSWSSGRSTVSRGAVADSPGRLSAESSSLSSKKVLLLCSSLRTGTSRSGAFGPFLSAVVVLCADDDLDLSRTEDVAEQPVVFLEVGMSRPC